jgi:hypothetical protein
VIANDNKQYSRRNNIRIKGLSVQPHGDYCRAVVDFCRNKLYLRDLDTGVTETAHKVAGRDGTNSNEGASAVETTLSATPKKSLSSL